MIRFKRNEWLPSFEVREACYGNRGLSGISQVIVAPSKEVAIEILKAKLVATAKWVRSGSSGHKYLPTKKELKTVATIAYRSGDLGGKHDR